MRFVRFFLLVMIAAHAGCTSQPVREIKGLFQSKGEPQLQAGIKLYEDGRYKDALTSFQAALGAGLGVNDQITANKYLAFISCVSGRERQCRAYFSRALEL